MLYTGNRATSGDGTAVVTAPAGSVLTVGGYVFLQLTEAGPVTAILKFVKGGAAVTVHGAIKMASDGDGIVVDLPRQTSVAGAALHINLDGAKSVNYTIDVDVTAA